MGLTRRLRRGWRGVRQALRDGTATLVSCGSLASASCALGLLLVSMPTGSLVAQSPSAPTGWQVVSAHFEADLTAADGGADVVVTYVLRARSGVGLPLAEPVELDLLGFGEATATSVRVDGVRQVALWETVGSHRAVSILAPEGARGDTLAMSFAYRVEQAVDDAGGALHARIPVLAGPSAPVQGGAGFAARLMLPSGWRPNESFPAGLRQEGDGDYVVALPVVPAMVGFRGRSDGEWRIGLPVYVDVLILTILLAFSIAGWWHLRRVAREVRP